MTTPAISADRPRFVVKPMQAIRHARLMADNPEDTAQVYHIRDALRGPAFFSAATAFLESDIGKRIFDEENDLAALLEDEDRLAAMPEGSIGHSYAQFMAGENLSAKGLVAAYDRSMASVKKYGDRIDWYLERQRDTHDLMHVITGYGRDNLGEHALLGFSHSQCPSWGALFIAYVGGTMLRMKTPRNISIFKPIFEGKRNGRAAQKFAHLPIKDMLPMQVEEIRDKMHIATPHLYFENLRKLEATQIDPFDILGNHTGVSEQRA